jgi:hypothetical protein
MQQYGQMDGQTDVLFMNVIHLLLSQLIELVNLLTIQYNANICSSDTFLSYSGLCYNERGYNEQMLQRSFSQ